MIRLIEWYRRLFDTSKIREYQILTVNIQTLEICRKELYRFQHIPPQVDGLILIKELMNEHGTLILKQRWLFDSMSLRAQSYVLANKLTDITDV